MRVLGLLIFKLGRLIDWIFKPFDKYDNVIKHIMPLFSVSSLRFIGNMLDIRKGLDNYMLTTPSGGATSPLAFTTKSTNLLRHTVLDN